MVVASGAPACHTRLGLGEALFRRAGDVAQVVLRRWQERRGGPAVSEEDVYQDIVRHCCIRAKRTRIGAHVESASVCKPNEPADCGPDESPI